MAAYAAVTSLMHILDQLHHHPFPPISLDKQQVESLTQIATFLQQFLESYDSPFAYGDEADPLEIRIMNAAYAAEDAIESQIVEVIKKSPTYHNKTYSREYSESNYVKNKYGFEEETRSNFVEESDDEFSSQILNERLTVAYEAFLETVSHSSSVSLNRQQLGCLTEISTFLQQFIEAYAAEDAAKEEAYGSLDADYEAEDAMEEEAYGSPDADYAAEDAAEEEAYGSLDADYEAEDATEEEAYGSPDADSDYAAEDATEEEAYGSLDADYEAEDATEEEAYGSPDADYAAAEDAKEEGYGSPDGFVEEDDDPEEETRSRSESNSVEEEDDQFSSQILNEKLTAAYVAFASLVETVNHSPPIPLDLGCLTAISTSQQQFLEAYDPPDAAYAAEGAIEDEAYGSPGFAYNDAAYAAEDAIEEEGYGSPGFAYDDEEEEVNLEVSCINLYEDLHHVIEEMNSIKKMAMEIETENELVRDFSSRSSSTEQRLQSTTMVCSDDVLLEIMEKLKFGSPHLRVIPITGMGGIGKTTLARTVYSKPLVKGYFDISVWVTISQKFNTREILCELCQTEGLSEDDAGSALYKYLFGRRFLIVMDDMWSIDAWDAVRRYFPDNGNGSRVLVTTRLSQLTSLLPNDYSLEMKFLDGGHSWELFSKTVFGVESCPCELKETGEKIVSNCKGLPLSIIVVGGVLKQVELTQERWESIRKDFTSVVNLENDEHSLRLLKLSYNHLPAYIKPCFLYMGVFEEDSKIRVSMLVKLWVSEGFLKPMNGKSMEAIAQGFVRDLIDRNLILTDESTRNENIKYCRIHDLLRDLCLREGGKYGFFDVMGQCSIQGMNSQRRLVIPRTSLFDEPQSMSFARSVICEYGKNLSCQNFRLLRILHAYIVGSYDHRCDVKTLAFECVNLRHFAGRVDSMSSFLSSIILVWNLRTLIVDSNYCDCKAPVEIWNMAQLRHIEFITGPLYLPYPNGRDDDVVVVMENLQILKGVMNFECREEVLQRCPNLRKLRIRYSDDEVIDSLINIERLRKLESLFISSEKEPYGFNYLHVLTFPHSLKSLSLHCGFSELEDVLGKVDSLPLLQKLKLKHGSFRTGKWEIAEDQFPRLKYLSLSLCSGLKHWTTDEQLHLYEMKELETIPCEIGNIASLQKIVLAHCCDSAVLSVRDIVDDQVESQGEVLSFHVVIRLSPNQEAPETTLPTPNFEVK